MKDSRIERAVSQFAKETQELYGEKLAQIILFGSCARGDADAESDIDIMVLLDMSTDEAQRERSKVTEISNRIDSEFGYDILIAPIVQSKSVFLKYKNVLPFYMNVEREGIPYVPGHPGNTGRSFV